jgi:formylglycine-generating enzyme required for sulfatase activity
MNNPEDINELHHQIAALQRAITDFEKAGLDDDAAALRARVAGLQAQNQTHGGTVIAGDVDTGGGNFAGRDQVNITLDPEKASREELLHAYYRQLADECGQLPLGTVDPEFARPARQVSLHQVYVGLDVVAPVRAADEDKRAWGLRLARGEGDGRTPLLEALAEPEAARVVLLGDPGSGKSTFVNYLTYRLADAAAENKAPDDLPADVQGLWPARLILREVARFLPPDACGTADLLWQALRADLTQRLGEVAAQRLLPHLQARLLRRGWFLLDGLDEVPTAHRRRECLLEAIQALLTQQIGGRMLLTARPYAYADDAWQLPGLPILALAPFDEAQVNRFVKGWYEAVRPVMGWSPVEATARGEQLSGALQARPPLGDLASRPLLLTLMATLHTSWGQLPEDRADLYEESVKLLLARWQRARTVRTPEGEELQPGITAKLDTELQPLRRALERLAYDAHVQQAQAPERDDTPADISEGDVLVALCDVLPENVNARNVLPYLKHRAGLLLERRPGVYAFPHRSFQEYLAACYLAETEKDFGERLRELIWSDPMWWREVFLLGVGKARQGGLSNAVAVINTLLPNEVVDVDSPTPNHWRAASLAGEALLNIGLLNQVQARPHHRTLLRRVSRWLVVLMDAPSFCNIDVVVRLLGSNTLRTVHAGIRIDKAGLKSVSKSHQTEVRELKIDHVWKRTAGRLSAMERAAAGDILAQLGDPRPHVALVDRMHFCYIPPGPFWMGSERYDREKPQHLNKHLAYRYWIARYPVTVAQFLEFIEKSDYRPVTELSLQGLDNHPVVDVARKDAVTFCRWLTKRWDRKGYLPTGWKVRLPTEAEWEKAARGGVLIPDTPKIVRASALTAEVSRISMNLNPEPKRPYPWGERIEPNQMNYDNTGLGAIAAVGCFPNGTGPYGTEGQSGNVWEWTQSLWGENVREPDFIYPYDPEDGRENPDAGDEVRRVVRGGSFNYTANCARCAYRGRYYPPNSWNDYGGFRVVVSLDQHQCV